jgi:hypothetical protein
MSTWQLGFITLVVGLYCWGTLIVAAAMTWRNKAEEHKDV